MAYTAKRIKPIQKTIEMELRKNMAASFNDLILKDKNGKKVIIKITPTIHKP